MEKTVDYYEHTHLSRGDEDSSQEIILEGDQKSCSITIIPEQNESEEKSSENDIDQFSNNICNSEELLLNNKLSLEDEEAANKLQIFSNSKIDLVMPSLRSLGSFAKGESSSTTSIVQSGPATNWSHLECVQIDKSIRKYNSMVTLPNVVHNRSPVVPVNLLPGNSTVRSKRCSVLSLASYTSSTGSSSSFVTYSDQPIAMCKVCLNEVPLDMCWKLQQCRCSICIKCVKEYVKFEINQGTYNIMCPDAQCPEQCIIQMEEIKALVDKSEIEKYFRYRLKKEVESDKSRMWCPKQGCETVCHIGDGTELRCVECPTCQTKFCSGCQAIWHPKEPCQSVIDNTLIFDSNLIKYCPKCSIPIEKNKGCISMTCNRCEFKFCWNCLASLNDESILRHVLKKCPHKTSRRRRILFNILENSLCVFWGVLFFCFMYFFYLDVKKLVRMIKSMK